MKLKETLNLGKTNFAMRANLPLKEVELQAEWEQAEIYKKIQEKNANRPAYILHDGPPYANGKLHMGHALNKISKDFIVRYKSMSGFRAPYIPGWDTHGLPIEAALTNSEGIDRKKFSVADFRRLCEEYALKQVDEQRKDFKRLGVTGDWDNPYLTLQPKYEAEQLRIFGKMAEKGYIYKGLKPIYWSPSSESSLAEAEIEYKDVTSPSIYVAFKVLEHQGVVPENAEFVIWTTTPWTLPANLGISVSPDATYVAVQVEERLFIVAKELLETVAKAVAWSEYEIVAEYQGAQFDRLTAQHPFYDRASLVMVGDHVTLDAGTGLVHTAPGHGEDDYQVGLRYNLDILSPLDNRGHFTAEAPGFEGIFYIKANQLVIDTLIEKNRLLAQGELLHSYPHDWRTKKPVIYRATPQWFASIDKFRQQLLTSVEQDVTWHHPSGQVRIYNMLRDRGDWVISRQRVWGVPLPIFYAENGEEILDSAVIEHVAQLVEEHGSNIWFERDAKELLPAGFTHPGSPNGEFTKEMDIMDVWFDSGTSYASVLKREGQQFPADLYLEGSDQYRGWFNSSFTTSVAANNQPPYKAVLSQGFVMDGKGQKMSKSLGNVIVPEEVMKELGADIIRLWVASVDYENDVRISNDILKQVSETYRKIRNTIRFMLSNIGDFNPETDKVDTLRPVDQYLMAKFDVLVNDVLTAYDEFQYSTIYKKVINFITVDLSAFYLDFAKDVLYIESTNAYPRRAMQTVIYHVLRNLIPLLTPILLHTMEEAWKELPGAEGFVQLQDMPEKRDVTAAKALIEQWTPFFEVQSAVNKALEVAKNDEVSPIKKSFEAAVTVFAPEEVLEQVSVLSDDLAQLLIVSQLSLQPLSQADDSVEDYDGFKVLVQPAQGHVCERCRAVRPEVGTVDGAPELCHRCHAIVKEHFSEYFE
ncbi:MULTISPECIES: isoleucine--tRNA ligase [unclassified Facklamia]|uniref:isoleucine--tRNA ligase n=1 Tax=Aerococcaceae TaxID=186827 RepID=UPI0013BD366B|nr:MULTISPECIES: isoleucine--tRNA ligase [unclassified Facklamia]NEW63744.1 isoleucine--tRNA ligase [Facklamia sp. 252]NEW67215.1 isoleucine--tRNA ligase [Facklamia sp. 253]QQD66247.1 isoleucine--tRNA ligase [Aerococcaceae bacterium zg-252]